MDEIINFVSKEKMPVLQAASPYPTDQSRTSHTGTTSISLLVKSDAKRWRELWIWIWIRSSFKTHIELSILRALTIYESESFKLRFSLKYLIHQPILHTLFDNFPILYFDYNSAEIW